MLKPAGEGNFHIACETVLDIANMLIAEYRLESPDTYAGSIQILGKSEILSFDFAQSFSVIAKFRNILVHDYLTIDDQKVYQHLQEDPDDFVSFADQVTAYLQ